ncbi:MAG: isocitrate lyase/phosphoenolpyruvate mutase family protein, partial [Phenylobacterium sp.]|nr:isocitrate lyase/phosphoenolpyruvate mutase family protein [Phenylobacterium sp.]
AVIIEDKTGLKKNSLFGTEVEQTLDSIEAFSHKIVMAKQAQQTEHFMVIARLESLIAGYGVDHAIERAKASQALTDETLVRKGKEGPEEQILRETREGAGVAPLHPNHHHHREDPAVEAELDDGMEM